MDPESKRLYKEAWHRGRLYGEKIWRAKLSARIKEIQSRKNIQENGNEKIGDTGGFKEEKGSIS